MNMGSAFVYSDPVAGAGNATRKNNMTRATEYVNHMYSLYQGRAAVTVGVNDEFNSIHPFVFENEHKVPVGLIALSAASIAEPTEVDVYHISAFIPGQGQGTAILSFLCKAADDFKVRLCVHAQIQHNGNQTLTNVDLVNWYHKFGFTGDRMMRREPNA
jgi:hypothetical protein